jgi:hypothetical protein
MMNNDQWLDPNIERRPVTNTNSCDPGLGCALLVVAAVVAVVVAMIWYGAPFVQRGWIRMDEIRPNEYAQIEEWDHDWNHDYIQECLSDGIITRHEYKRIYWSLNDGWVDRLKDKK